jgi:hypothetical protein
MPRGGIILEEHAWDAASAILRRFGRVESLPLPGRSRSIDRAARLVLTDGRMLELRLDIRRIPSPGKVLHEQAIAHAALRLAAAPNDPTVANGVAILVPAMPTGLGDAVRHLLAPLGRSPLNVIVISAAGGWWCWLPGVGINAIEADHAGSRAAKHPQSNGELPLTAVNQWLLKILLLGGVKQSWWAGPRLTEATGQGLAATAGIGASTAYRLITALSVRGWVGNDLRLSRVDALARYWLDHARHVRASALLVRPLFGALTGPDAVRAWLGKQGVVDGCRWALGSWAACDAHGVGMVTGAARPAIHVTGSVESLMRQWELTTCDERDAAFVIEPCDQAMAQPLIGGAVIIDGMPVVDVWQAALDVARDPGRGGDQAWAIAQRIMDLEDTSDG